MRRFQAVLLMGCCGLVLTATALAQRPADAPKLADYFGFQPLEIYKLERRIGNLMIRDLDGDKTGDIIVGNNARSRIDLLLSTKRPNDEAESRPFRKEINDLEFDKRMRLVSVPVNKEVVSLATGDFNGDGKPDLVYYGTPAEVEILFNEGSGRFGGSKKIASGDAVQAPGALAVGDLDQDGRDDIVLLAENDLVFIYQTATGVLSEPERVPHTASNPGMVKLVDLDGNGALDMVILDGGTDHPIHVRFATHEKKLGPEQRFQVEAPRDRLWPDRRPRRRGNPHHRKPVRPGPGLDARRINNRRAEQVGPLDLLWTSPGKRPRPVCGRRRSGRRQA